MAAKSVALLALREIGLPHPACVPKALRQAGDNFQIVLNRRNPVTVKREACFFFYSSFTSLSNLHQTDTRHA
ncbi:MAG: hypothetical protein ABSD46_09400 [Bacteroidota bacterium]